MAVSGRRAVTANSPSIHPAAAIDGGGRLLLQRQSCSCGFTRVCS